MTKMTMQMIENAKTILDSVQAMSALKIIHAKTSNAILKIPKRVLLADSAIQQPKHAYNVSKTLTAPLQQTSGKTGLPIRPQIQPTTKNVISHSLAT
jgi:hypothetical protein